MPKRLTRHLMRSYDSVYNIKKKQNSLQTTFGPSSSSNMWSCVLTLFQQMEGSTTHSKPPQRAERRPQLEKLFLDVGQVKTPTTRLVRTPILSYTYWLKIANEEDPYSRWWNKFRQKLLRSVRWSCRHTLDEIFTHYINKIDIIPNPHHSKLFTDHGHGNSCIVIIHTKVVQHR